MTWTELAPIEILLLTEHPMEHREWQQAASDAGIQVLPCDEPGALLSSLASGNADAVILPLGAREEESLLLCRAIHKRRAQHPVHIFLIDRGGRLVRPDHSAESLGANARLGDVPPAEAIAAIIAHIDATSSALASIDERGEHALARRATPMTTAPTDSPRMATLEALYLKLRQALHGDYFTLLGVPMEASSDQILDAFTRLYERFDLAALPREIATRHAREITALRETLTDAWHVLGSDASRGHYLDALHQPDALHVFVSTDASRPPDVS